MGSQETSYLTGGQNSLRNFCWRSVRWLEKQLVYILVTNHRVRTIRTCESARTVLPRIQGPFKLDQTAVAGVVCPQHPSLISLVYPLSGMSLFTIPLFPDTEPEVNVPSDAALVHCCWQMWARVRSTLTKSSTACKNTADRGRQAAPTTALVREFGSRFSSCQTAKRQVS